MNTCKICKHWGADDEPWSRHMTHPYDPDIMNLMILPWEARVCMQPTQTRFERPVESNGFGLTDASTYYAALVTGEDFGCVQYESGEE
jgi:hypothetical protein